MIKLAVVGIGWAGQRQIQAVAELGNKVTVTSIMDNDAEFMAEKAKELGIDKTFTDYRALLSDPDIDAVSICTPHPLHCPMSIDAAKAGKHILVEKPMAMTVEEATKMIEAAEEHQVKLFVAEQWAYSPMTLFLRDIVQTQKYIGELTAASFSWGFQSKNFGYAGRRAWLTRPQQGGTGTWMLHGIHSMARFRRILGEVKTVYLQEHHNTLFERPDIEGTMSGLFTLENGVHVSILQSVELQLSDSLGALILHGDKGSIRAWETQYELFSPSHDRDIKAEVHSYPEAELTDYALEIEAFADYVNGVNAGITTGFSERRTLAIVQAGYESAQSGNPIHLKERFGDL